MKWTSLPPLSALRAFAAYAETGAVQKAGDALNVSHAAISQQIRNLEDHTGLALLDRSGRAAVLTAEGRELAAALAEGFGTIAARLDTLTGAEDDRPLHVTTTPSFAANWLMPRVADFRATFPDLALMVDPNPAISNPARGGVDLAVRYGSGTWPGYEAEMFLPSSVAIVAGPNLLDGREVNSPADLADLPWLQELGTSEASLWLHMRGVDQPNRVAALHLPGNMMIEAARNGQGVAITARVWIEEDLKQGRLRLLFEEAKENGYHLVTAPGVQRPALRSLVRWLRKQAS